MHHGKQILVADRAPGERGKLGALLRPQGWQVSEAGTFGETVRKMDRDGETIVLADEQLGLQALTTLRNKYPAAPVIVLLRDPSAPEPVVWCIRQGMYGAIRLTDIGRNGCCHALLELIDTAWRYPSPPNELELLAGRPQWLDLQVRATRGAPERVVSYLREINPDIQPAIRDSVTTGVREMLLNAIEHGAKFDPDKKVRVNFVRTSRSVIFHIADPGAGFDYLDLPHAAVSNPPDAPTGHIEYRTERGLRPGGFGILLVQSLVDELIYNEKGNEVLLVKYL